MLTLFALALSPRLVLLLAVAGLFAGIGQVQRIGEAMQSRRRRR